MPSIIEGYNYDIFISYRQKDNKGDKWVSEFVDSLNTELESTFKEEISVYFDINPHDGLLETHDVDASLKDKLKCLVFIPIISRTYCDPKSFAWEHEFKAFVEQISKDQFGLKVKLPNGNVASRVLPVRIHDLEKEDVKCFEEVTGGVLRTLDFVFKTSSGVNRPLKSKEDHPGDNLNKTYYQDQINKVALAIKEIFQGMKAEPVPTVKEKPMHKELLEEDKKEKWKEFQDKPSKLSKRKWLTGAIVIVILFVIAAILAYLKIFKRDPLERLRASGERITVAVMPFRNMTNDTIWNVWQEGIQYNLITSLSNNPEELKVRQIESITGLLQNKGLTDYSSITPSIASNISQKLDANVFIQGNINQGGYTIRINAQLVDSKTEESFKSFQINGSAENILLIIDSLSVMIKNFLIVSKLEKEGTIDIQHLAPTNYPEAYRDFIYGHKEFLKGDFPAAVKLYSQAIDIDSNYISAIFFLSVAYLNQGLYNEAKKWCLKLYGKRDQMTIQQKIMTNELYTEYFDTPYEAIKYFKQLHEIDDQWPTSYFQLGRIYNQLHQYDKAIPELEKALEIYNKWDSKPMWAWNYTWLGAAYHYTGQYKKEKKLYKKAEEDFPDNYFLRYNQAILALTIGDTAEANEYIQKYISRRQEGLASEADIKGGLAGIYNIAGILDKAEAYYREALSLEPENLGRQNTLAYFLIDKERSISQGLELIDKALEISPDNYNYLHTKGWGLYKQGKFKEALEILQKSWDIRREKAIYNHEAYLHLEAAKKAVASQKNN